MDMQERELVLKSYKDIADGKGRDCNDFFDELENRYLEKEDKDLISIEKWYYDCISNNEELNRMVYKIAKKMLNHRSGTLYEDMYWIDIDTGEIVASEVNQKVEKGIKYSKATLREIKKHKNILKILI